MKVAFITDLHLEEDPGTGEIYEHQQDGMEQVIEGIEEAQPDLILIGGDNSGPAPPYKSSPAERNAHIFYRQSLAVLAPVIEVQGNHDYPGDYMVFNELRADHPIIFLEEPGSVDCSRTPGMDDVECVVWCLPWIFSAEADGEEHQEYARSIAAAVVEEAMEQWERDQDVGLERPHFLLCHGAVDGALLREGQPRVPVEDPLLDPDELLPINATTDEPLFDAAFFGHYHHRQVVKTDGAGRPMGVYGGSVFVRAFGEDMDKGWCLFDTATGAYSFETITQPGKLVVVYDPASDTILETRPDLGLSGWVGDYSFGEIMVRIIVTMPKSGIGEHLSNLESLRAAIAKTAANVEVIYKAETKPSTREGAAEIAAAATIEDKVREFLAKHSPDKPTEEEVEEAISLFEEIRTAADAGR